MSDFYGDAEEEDIVRRLHAVGRDLRAVEDFRRNLAATRRGLVRTLIDRFLWSQHGVARELGVSQAMVSKIINGKKKKVKGGEAEAAAREYRALVARYESDPEYRAYIERLAAEIPPP